MTAITICKGSYLELRLDNRWQIAPGYFWEVWRTPIGFEPIASAFEETGSLLSPFNRMKHYPRGHGYLAVREEPCRFRSRKLRYRFIDPNMGHFTKTLVMLSIHLHVFLMQSFCMKKKVVFVGTAKSGLGHLRRIASVAASMNMGPGAGDLVLLTNAEPAGLSPDELAVFAEVCVCERRDMAVRVLQEGCDLAVLDTVELPGFERFYGPAALMLRETPDMNLERFRRAGSRPWDLLLVPNPKGAWTPKVGPDYARSVVHAGWILRETGIRGDSLSSGIVVATGGGGTADTRRGLYPVLNRILEEVQRKSPYSLTLRQALGPRAAGEKLTQASEAFDPGSALNDVFRRADLVISTAGYNSVLELASTDTPTLLVAIPRSLDDQLARVRRWGPLLGHGLEPGSEQEAVGWLVDQISMPRRRAPVDLGSGGADRAANALLELLCPVS